MKNKEDDLHWKVFAGTIIKDFDDNVVAWVPELPFRTTRERAVLIAAAPRLLSALKMAKSFLEPLDYIDEEVIEQIKDAIDCAELK